MNLYGKVPDHYMPQVQGQMFITGRKLAHFICWTPESFEVHEVPFDEDYWHVNALSCAVRVLQLLEVRPRTQKTERNQFYQPLNYRRLI
jgi:hypothetical protein